VPQGRLAGNGSALAGRIHKPRLQSSRTHWIEQARNPRRVAGLGFVGSPAGCESGESAADRYPKVPAGEFAFGRVSSAKHARGARGASLGQDGRQDALEGVNPKGASSPRLAKHPSRVLGLRGRAKARKPVVAMPAGASRTGDCRVLTAGGCGERGNPFPPPGRRSSAGGNPRSAVGMKQTRPGVEGSKPSGG